MEVAITYGCIQNIRIIMSRKYDSAKDSRKRTTQERKAICYELSYYLSGEESSSVTINGTEYKIHTGNVRFVRPGDRIFSTAHFSCLTVLFEFGGSMDINETQLFREIKPFFSVSKSMEALFLRLISLEAKEQAEDCLMQYSLLFQILSLLCQVNAAPRYSPVIRLCIDYMNKHLNADITLTDLGAYAGYSPLHLRRLFLASTGMSPHEYLSELRLNRAKVLLMQTELPIDRVADECGYRSSTHFKAMFKKKVQMTPGSFRRTVE